MGIFVNLKKPLLCHGFQLDPNALADLDCGDILYGSHCRIGLCQF